MNKQLAPAEQVYLRGVGNSRQISYNNNMIQSGEFGIVLESSSHIVSVWIRLDEIDNFLDDLDRYSSGNSSKCEYIEASISRERIQQECPVCGDRVPAGIRGIRMIPLFIHDDCVEDLITSIESVWDYSDVVLSSTFTSDDSE